VIDEHQQKQLVEGTTSPIIPSSSTTLTHHQGEQQGLSSSNSMKIISSGKQKETKIVIGSFLSRSIHNCLMRHVICRMRKTKKTVMSACLF